MDTATYEGYIEKIEKYKKLEEQEKLLKTLNLKLNEALTKEPNRSMYIGITGYSGSVTIPLRIKNEVIDSIQISIQEEEYRLKQEKSEI